MTANNEYGSPLFHIVVSVRGDDVVIWIKPPTLRNGYPITLDANTMIKLDKLINALTLLKNAMPDILKEVGVNIRQRGNISISGDSIVL